jgi:heme/copper-type cytochrome/quinol oxidase subunit 1
MMTSYVPMMAAPAFYLGLILFAVGALIGCFVFLGTLVVAKAREDLQGSVPLVTFGAITACIIAVFTIASGAIILIPTFLMSMGIIKEVDPLVYRTIWWAFGHSSQQINVAAHISIWYAVAAIAFGAKPMSERVSRGAFLLYILFLQLASAHHLLADPGCQHRLEGRQHQLLHVLRGAGLDDPRPDHSRRDGSGAAQEGLTTRACSSGCARRPGATRCSRACSSRSSASASWAASRA